MAVAAERRSGDADAEDPNAEAAEHEQSSPRGSSADYNSTHVAEEEAAAVIDTILTNGGAELWQKYLERKAFGFATDAVTESVVSQLQMRFVAHDRGEEDMEDSWDLEDEPEAGEIDSWARMHLPVRRLHAGDGHPPGTGMSRQARSTSNMNRSQQAQGMRSTRTSDTRARTTPRAVKLEKPESRSMPLQEEVVVDEEEEQLRDAKIQEEVRRREKERKARETEKTKEEERRKVQVLHEEMSKRAHTFDTEGNIIWVEEFKLERLPKVQEAAGYTIKKDPKSRTGGIEEALRSTASGNPAKPQEPSASKDAAASQKASRRGQRGQRRGDKKQAERAEPEFTDGFSKLQHGQPPILETMLVQAGVTLEAMGKKKAGVQDVADRQVMSRKEYNLMAEREVATDYRGGGAANASTHTDFERSSKAAIPELDQLDLGPQLASSQGGPGLGAGGAGTPAPGAPPAQAPGAPPSYGAAAAQLPGAAGGGGGVPSGGLPPLRGTRGAPTSGIAAAAGTAAPGGAGKPAGRAGDPDAPPVQRAPPAPPPGVRHMGKKFEAMGHVAFQRAPRYHVPQLGGPTGYGSAQPPLGATMGHGLVRHGSLKEDYFFPPTMPELPIPLLRSTSEASIGLGSSQRPPAMGSGRGLGSSRGGMGPLGGTPKGSAGTPKGLPGKGASKEMSRDSVDMEDGAGHGFVRAETMSPAYRNFRHQLLPPETSTTSGPMVGSYGTHGSRGF